MANALTNILQAPLNAVFGAFGGLSDGLRGKVDENEKFEDGKYGDDPLLKSRAGRVLSEYAGVRGGEEVGKKVGGWGAAAGAAYMTGSFLAAFIGAAGLVGAFPIFAAGVLVVGAALAGGFIGSWAGKHVGRVVGGVVGAAGGAAVGAYNGAFGRGYFKDPEKGKGYDSPASPEQEPQVATPQQQPAQQAAYEQSPQTSGGFVDRLNQQRSATRVPPAARASAGRTA